MREAIDRKAAAAVLGATTLFAGLDDTALHGLAAAVSQRSFRRGQYLWYEGDDGDRLLVVVSGLLKVMVTTEQGDEVVLTTVGPRESIGELAVLNRVPRSATVVAVEPTTVLSLGRATVLELMARHPSVLDAVLRALGDLVRRLTEQTSDLIVLDLGARLAKLLLRLAGPAAAGVDHGGRARPGTVAVRPRGDGRGHPAGGQPGVAAARVPWPHRRGRAGDQAV